ncbi:sulfite oxidase [Streptomyces sp. NPDC048441]|uniref:sulfite oxidase n=1 Tax=Streptomyces sp. NPDC048441 TaxID=3365552 RepID=UPI0037136A87
MTPMISKETSEEAYEGRRRAQWLAAGGPARRDLLRLLAATGAAGAASALGARPAAAASSTPRSSGIIKPLPPARFTIRGTNAETKFEALAETGYYTPVSHFFVRNHTATPRVDAKTWTLKVWGDGLKGGPREPREFTLADLKRLPSTTTSALIECAGNARSFFTTQQGQPASGTAWTQGAVGNARWRGVRLSEVLRLAGVSRHAVDVMPRGLDADYITDDGTNLGKVRRPLPLSKAMEDVILAYEMNGAPLPPDHGYPVRLVAPSWVGIASIKWVGDIEVSSTPLHSPWNTQFYRLFGEAYPPEGSTPLTRQTLKSAFELPWNASLPANRTHHLTGRAWSAKAPVARVDISTDGGETWHQAHLKDSPRQSSWTRWTTPWHPSTPGTTTLLSRTTDTSGHTQPEATVHNTQGYLFDAVVRHVVRVV